MPKDYARYVNKPKRPAAEHGWRKRLLLVFFLTLFLLSISFGFYLYKHSEGGFSQQAGVWVKQVKSWFVKTPSGQEASQSEEDQESDEEAKPEPEIQFSFYTDLPTMQVSAPPVEVISRTVEVKSKPSKVVEAAKVAKSAETPAVSPRQNIEEKYLLQIAAFKNPSAAGEMRISLLLAGFEVEIVKAVNNNQEIYQLQQGPYSSVGQAKSMQKELQKKGIESVIIKRIA